MNDFSPKSIIFTKEKHHYSRSLDGFPNILIDDYGENIRMWSANGGIGIKHKDYKFERTTKNILSLLLDK